MKNNMASYISYITDQPIFYTSFYVYSTWISLYKSEIN